MRLLLLALLLFLGAVSGQEQAGSRWTVQTAAFQDYRQATSQIDQLHDLGFDAYSEFVMSGGRQFTRVRLGCFSTRAAAEAFAEALRGRVTAEAAPQPLSEGASTDACVEWDTGFLKPQTWEIERRGEDILFRVEFGGQVGYLQHGGNGWRFMRSRPPPEPAPAERRDRFTEVRIGGQTLVQARLTSGTSVNACAGQLLWQSGLTAVVERPGSVIACVVDESPRRSP